MGDIADLNPRLTSPLNPKARVSFLPMSAVTAETASTTTGEERTYQEVSRGYTPFLSGDILVAKITPCFENGKIAQAILSHPVGFGSTEFHVIRPIPAKADTRYLLHFLRQESIRRDGERRMIGSAGQKRVPESFFMELKISPPPLADQRRIAEVLDRAEGLRAKRRKSIELLNILNQCIFNEIVGDQFANPKSWETQSLGSISEFENGDRSSNYPSGDDIMADGILFLSTKNITDSQLDLSNSVYITSEKFQSLSRGKIRRKDLVITLRGTLGSCCIFDSFHETAFINAQMMIIRPSKSIVPEFLHATLTNKKAKEIFIRIGHGAAVPQLTSAQLSTLPILVPPLDVQKEFARRIVAVEELKAAHRASLAQLDAIFASLQHRAFQGEL